MTLIRILVIALLLAAGAPGQAAAKDDSMAWTNDQAMLLFFEAVSKIKKQQISDPGAMEIVRGAIRGYLRANDPYGDYLSPEEYATWLKAQSYSFFGVGMDILQREGKYFCLPRPDGPASSAGVVDGDELLAVDGQTVAGKSLYWVGGRIRGQKGSTVRLGLRSPAGKQRQLSLKRLPLEARSVWLRQADGLNIIRLSAFSPQTMPELLAALEKIPPRQPLVLDLRGNPGGDLFAAVDIAGLFLPTGVKVLTTAGGGGSSLYRAKGRKWRGDEIAVWQDGFTASAAEVLTAALVENRAAVSLGEASFGKGLTQRVVELSDGSAMVISRALLRGPSGATWQGEGLQPMVAVPPGSSEAHWNAHTIRALKKTH